MATKSFSPKNGGFPTTARLDSLFNDLYFEIPKGGMGAEYNHVTNTIDVHFKEGTKTEAIEKVFKEKRYVEV